MADKMWFRRKKYGWGWVPQTWQGWLVILGVSGCIIYSALQQKSGAITQHDMVIRIIVATAFLIFVGYLKGPKPEWRWG